MSKREINLAPYRTALEALIAHHTPAKCSALLGNAAANLDDPWLRTQLKAFINRLPRMADSTPIQLMSYYPNSSQMDEVVQYIESVIDGQESAWEVIANSYGWYAREASKK